MTEPRDKIPKLGLVALSSHVADLLLVGVGEDATVRQPKARRAWHVFFFAVMLFLVWHVMARFILVPSNLSDIIFLANIRLIDAICYSVLLLSLACVAYYHYRYLMLPARSLRFSNIVFFYFMFVFLFARLYYSLYHFRPGLFTFTESVTIPSPHFGIRGLQDLAGFCEFLVFSGCTMLNFSYSRIQSTSLVISSISLIQVIIGYLIIVLLVATFVQLKIGKQGNSNGTGPGL